MIVLIQSHKGTFVIYIYSSYIEFSLDMNLSLHYLFHFYCVMCMQLAMKNIIKKRLKKFYLKIGAKLGNYDILLSVELPIMAPLIGRSDTDLI